MGSCISTIKKHNNVSNKFLKYNILDKKHNIIIGIYSDIDENKKSNTLINQGICIGYNNNKIHKIKFGIIHLLNNKIIELYFENDIKLIFIKENNNKIKMLISFSDLKIEKYMDLNITKKHKLINNNSEYIDLIYDLINNEKN